MSNINIHLALDSISADCHQDIISNPDGSMNRGYKQTDLTFMVSQRPSTKFHTGGYYIDSIIMG